MPAYNEQATIRTIVARVLGLHHPAFYWWTLR
jgi:hypothetical protein